MDLIDSDPVKAAMQLLRMYKLVMLDNLSTANRLPRAEQRRLAITEAKINLQRTVAAIKYLENLK